MMEASMEKGEAREDRASPPAAVLRRVRKRFGYRDTLRGVDLEVPRGGCFVIFGPNGAGKTTVLRILATQWSTSEGEVEVLGLDARRERTEIRRRIGLVFHDSFLRMELTLDENLRLACDLHGLRFAEAAPRIDGLLERFRLAARRGDRVGTFSQGMKKRAGIARSLVHEPEMWILDEPFSGLDPSGQELLEEMIRAFPGGGRTVILVTHNEVRGVRLAGSSARLEEGRVVAVTPARAPA
jgi:ABC-type multidrug transport system ATPase subunit